MSKPKKIKDISLYIASGITPSRSNESYWKGGTIPWLKTEQLDEHKIYDTSEKITQAAVKETSIKIFPVNTLAIAMYGEGRTRGNVSILKKEMATNQACCNIVIDKAKADYEYVYYFFKTQYNQLRALSSGVRKNLNSNDIKEFEIRLPDKISTQQKIASVLSALDSKIELNNRINAELEAMAKTLYDYWFVQFDFPDADGKPFKTNGGKMVWNEELKREIPEGWEVKKLDDCIDKIIDYRGKTPNKLSSEWSDKPNDIVALSAKHVKNGKLINLENANRVDEKLYNIWMKDKLKEGDILMTSEAPCGEFFYLIGNTKYCLSQRLFAIRSSKDIIKSSYLYYELSSGNGYSQILGKVSGSTVFGIRQDELRTVNVLIPNLKIQEVFSANVIDIWKKIRNNDYQSKQLINLRDWLLPMLINGQITVSSLNEPEGQTVDVEKKEELFIADNKKAFAKQVLGGKIASLFQNDPHFTNIKFQKIQYLAEHVAEVDLNWNYYYQAAGPYDNVYMHTISDKFKISNWFAKEEHKFTPLAKQKQIEGYYQSFFQPVVNRLDHLFSLLADVTDIDAEIIATLYAVWNNRIILNQPVTEELLIEDFYNWSDRKLLYTPEQLQKGLQWLHTNNIVPTGFGKELKKAKGKK